ncbi:major outer membrane protein [Aliarcobacter skirrowii]|uniref:major outer membrane protein n=1 Tax=Aliarcobacter skirrowii TaxID=28200 RepID=UPI0029BA52D6|nr:major outer membrane protein [Aliarcobacter skirrowii]MDX4012313.1 major outer membrane protein [Aliarcobacter skirrowii]
MKKFTKLSLVAAVAVAGLSSANAKPLEEAIKDVEVSGSVVYRYNDNKAKNPSTNTENADADNNYKVGLNLSSKVNDYVKFNSRFIVGGDDSGFAGPLDTSSANDKNVNVTLSHAYFALTAIPNTTVNVGKQGLTTPWTVAIDSDGAEQTGTGVLALTTVGPVTAAAGYFNQTNLDKSGDTIVKSANGTFGQHGSKDIAVGALIANFEPVTIDAWYLNMSDVFDTFSLSATSKLELSEDAKIGLEARYVQLNLDKNVADTLATIPVLDRNNEDKNSMYRLAVDGKVGIVNAKVSYTSTDKKGGLTALDKDAKNTTLGWNLTSLDTFDADYWQVVVGVDLLDNLNLSANYGNLKHKSGNIATADTLKDQEYYAQLTYNMSKNLTTYVRYGKLEEKENGTKVADDTVGRLQVEYRF